MPFYDKSKSDSCLSCRAIEPLFPVQGSARGYVEGTSGDIVPARVSIVSDECCDAHANYHDVCKHVVVTPEVLLFVS